MQETIVRALAHVDSLTPGTNLRTWLFTILRNRFHSDLRRRRREVPDSSGNVAGALVALPHQSARLDFLDFTEALSQLSPDQREALLLVSAEGLPYKVAARICGAEIGTIKSRVSRANELRKKT